MVCIPTGTDWACHPDGEAGVAAMDASLKLWAEQMAWTTMASLTAHQLALCPTLARPCIRRPALSRFSSAVVGRSSLLSPIYINGDWINAWCGSCAGCCTHPLAEVMLPGPVGAIVKVTIDGVDLPANAYRIDDGNKLVRQDGDVWPSTQDLSLPDGAVGAWSVTYYRGWAPNDLTRRAAGLLALEFVKACTGGACRLPSGVTSVVRQGVSMEIQGDMFESGLTGIREVDAVIQAMNPNKLKSPPVILSPDSPRTRLTTLGAQMPAGGYGQGGYGE